MWSEVEYNSEKKEGINMFEKCRETVRAAGERIRNAGSITVEEKTDYRNLVTQYDMMTQDYLVAELSKIVPGASFVCEESDSRTLTDGPMFIIDPIDGTANFTRGYNLSAVSVAYAEGGSILFGIIYNPFTDEMWYAEKGKGAYLNGRRIHVSDGDLKHNLAAFGTSPYDTALRRKTLSLVSQVIDVSMDVRRCGSAALDMAGVACGRNGLFFEFQLSVWDYAAGIIIVREAGGIVTDIRGREINLKSEKSTMLAGNPVCHTEFLRHGFKY